MPIHSVRTGDRPSSPGWQTWSTPRGNTKVTPSSSSRRCDAPVPADVRGGCTITNGPLTTPDGVAVSGQALIGKIGTVVHAIRGSSGAGEVRVVVAGIPHYYIAYAEGAIPTGAEVLVINHRGARQVDVEPWPGLGVD